MEVVAVGDDHGIGFALEAVAVSVDLGHGCGFELEVAAVSDDHGCSSACSSAVEVAIRGKCAGGGSDLEEIVDTCTSDSSADSKSTGDCESSESSDTIFGSISSYTDGAAGFADSSDSESETDDGKYFDVGSTNTHTGSVSSNSSSDSIFACSTSIHMHTSGCASGSGISRVRGIVSMWSSVAET